MMRVRRSLVVVGFALGALWVALGGAHTLMGCASAPVVAARGADRASIHGVLAAAARDEGYACVAAPDLSFHACTHDARIDLGFAYLPASNLVQLWSIFSRDDPGLHPRWRHGPCADIDGAVGRINAETIVKVVCEERTLRFEMTSWTPARGLEVDDVHAWFGVFREIVGETIATRGLLNDGAADGAPAPTAHDAVAARKGAAPLVVVSARGPR